MEAPPVRSEAVPSVTGPAPDAPNRIKFDYIKSNLFRVVHVDGAIGGATPQGYVHMAIFSERLPIPTQVVHGVESGSRLGEEILAERVVKEAVVRELEVDCIMNIETAESLHNWLAQTIAKVHAVRAQANEESR